MTEASRSNVNESNQDARRLEKTMTSKVRTTKNAGINTSTPKHKAMAHPTYQRRRRASACKTANLLKDSFTNGTLTMHFNSGSKASMKQAYCQSSSQEAVYMHLHPIGGNCVKSTPCRHAGFPFNLQAIRLQTKYCEHTFSSMRSNWSLCLRRICRTLARNCAKAVQRVAC